MSLPLLYRPAAKAEFDEAADWYENQQPGLGIDFVAAVQRVLDTICLQPKRYPIVCQDVREAPVQRFPYCVYYRTGRNRLVVLAVFHTARDPSVWQSRI
jgi:plasmid stabilization system protein ParE